MYGGDNVPAGVRTRFDKSALLLPLPTLIEPSTARLLIHARPGPGREGEMAKVAPLPIAWLKMVNLSPAAKDGDAAGDVPVARKSGPVVHRHRGSEVAAVDCQRAGDDRRGRGVRAIA